MAKKDEAKAEGEAAIVETPDSPLLDLSDAAVKRMLKIAKKRGWVTQDELNAVLPSEEISSDQIEDMNAMLSEMGINVVESEDAEEADKENPEAADEEESEGGELVELGERVGEKEEQRIEVRWRLRSHERSGTREERSVGREREPLYGERGDCEIVERDVELVQGHAAGVLRRGA